jgi:zinc protease
VEDALAEELKKVKTDITERELAKVKNKAEASNAFSEMGIANKALNLAYYELLGDVSLCNDIQEKYAEVTADQIMRIAREVLTNDNCSILRYHAAKQSS